MAVPGIDEARKPVIGLVVLDWIITNLSFLHVCIVYIK